MLAVTETNIAPLAHSISDKRYHRRYEVKNGTVVTTRFSVVGHIIDLSEVGLAFRYVATRESAKEEQTLSILANNRTFRVNGIPFEVVWDIPVPELFSFGSIGMRYCGIKFRDLTDRQQFALRHFIHNHSKNAPDD